MTADKLDKGHLLIAEPSILGDVSFNRSVILLADHSSEGSVGFIINKPLPFYIGDLLPDITAKFRVYNGGPVEQDNLYFIHNIPHLVPNSVEISNGIYWGGDFELIKELMNSGKIEKQNIRFFLGYTGWDAQQLEREMNDHAWIVTQNSYKNKILSKPTSKFWKEKMMEQGGEYLVWSNAPDDPRQN